jgi:hypothetical protein
MKSRSRKSEPRWKRKERSAIKALQATFGRVSDPSLARLLTSTGRVGHLTRFGVDGFVGDDPGYAVEVKARKKMLTKPTLDALLQTIDRAARFDRIPLFVLVFGDDVPARTENGARVDREWVMMPRRVLDELVGKERADEQRD